MKKPLFLLLCAALAAPLPGSCGEISAWEGAGSRYDGPNCWGSSLAFAGVIGGLRHAEAEEFTFWAERSCRRLAPGEARRPGDLLALRMPFNGGGFMEKHAQVVASPEASLSKNNFRAGSRMATQPNAHLFSIVGVPDDPKCQGNRGSDEFACEAASDALRCEPLGLPSLARSPDDLAAALAVGRAESRVLARLAGSALRESDLSFALEDLRSAFAPALDPQLALGARLALASLSEQMSLIALAGEPDSDLASRLSDILASWARP